MSTLSVLQIYFLRADFARLIPGPLGQSKGSSMTTKLTDYVKTAAAAEFLGVAQNTLRKWAARGDIPMYRNPANGYRLFRKADLARFLNKIAKPILTVSPKKPR